jgi:outer membrane protein assembly factor BamB
MNRKTNVKSSIIMLVFILSCLCFSIITLWGTPIGRRVRPSLLQEATLTPPATNYLVATSSPQFEQLWVKSSIFNNYGTHQGSIHLATTGRYAFLLGSVEENKVGELSLTKLDLLTGEVEWFKFEASSFNEGAASTIDVNSNFIYVGFDGTQKISGDVTFGAGKVSAYAVDSGNMIWSKIVPGARGVDTLVATDFAVSVDGAFSSSNYLFDAETGDLLKAIEKPRLIWFINDGVTYERQKSFPFQAINRKTNEIIWQSIDAYYPSQPPTLTNKFIVARSGSTGFLGIAFAIDRVTGELIWEFNDVLSNVAVSDDTAFFLTSDVQLIAVDIETGEKVGQVSFGSNREPDHRSHIHYFVAASNGIVLVYFGESQQLFSFRFSSNE